MAAILFAWGLATFWAFCFFIVLPQWEKSAVPRARRSAPERGGQASVNSRHAVASSPAHGVR